jgi:hypothetical protein
LLVEPTNKRVFLQDDCCPLKFTKARSASRGAPGEQSIRIRKPKTGNEEKSYAEALAIKNERPLLALILWGSCINMLLANRKINFLLHFSKTKNSKM